MPIRNLKGASISFIDQGKGLPLVLLHGFPLDSRMWEAQVGELSSRHRVIAPDFRGFGKSGPASPFTMESLADDVHALLAELNALPCVLAGLSMGGYVVLNYARKYASDLRGLILVDTRAEGDTPQGKEGRQKMIELARSKGAKAIADQMEPKMLSPDTGENRPQVVRALRQMMESCLPEAIEHALVALRDRPDMTSQLPSIACPTLILVGDADAITPPNVAESMQKQIPHSQLVTIQGAGHMSPMEQPAQVNRALRNFLQAMASEDP